MMISYQELVRTFLSSRYADLDKTEWGYKKLPYDEWKFLFIYPKALPALATQALMVDGEGYKTTYQYLDNTRAESGQCRALE